MARCEKFAAMGNSRQNGAGEVVVGIQRDITKCKAKGRQNEERSKLVARRAKQYLRRTLPGEGKKEDIRLRGKYGSTDGLLGRLRKKDSGSRFQ